MFTNFRFIDLISRDWKKVLELWEDVIINNNNNNNNDNNNNNNNDNNNNNNNK